MANHATTYMDMSGLTAYDTKIKQYITQESAKAYKTVLLSANNQQLYFYKKADAVLGTDTPDFTVSLYPGEYVPTFNSSDNSLQFDF